ncbi:unnamed protein product [Trifolium pratense]|uniref:Uncharacterized protein n=1 Tax=Trifolium pratense TaxID=57577 RepID=A0ACB0J8W6_TRIPR|nr:unnamed protein product [Trifolium pratense]
MKKLNEMTTLCGIEACGIIYDNNNPHAEVWPSDSGVKNVLSRFGSFSELQRSKKLMDQSDYLRQNIHKAYEKLKKLVEENRKKEMINVIDHYIHTNEFTGNLMTKYDVNDFTSLIDENLQEIYRKMNELQIEAWGQVGNRGEVMNGTMQHENIGHVQGLLNGCDLEANMNNATGHDLEANYMGNDVGHVRGLLNGSDLEVMDNAPVYDLEANYMGNNVVGHVQVQGLLNGSDLEANMYNAVGHNLEANYMGNAVGHVHELLNGCDLEANMDNAAGHDLEANYMGNAVGHVHGLLNGCDLEANMDNIAGHDLEANYMGNDVGHVQGLNGRDLEANMGNVADVQGLEANMNYDMESEIEHLLWNFSMLPFYDINEDTSIFGQTGPYHP